MRGTPRRGRRSRRRRATPRWPRGEGSIARPTRSCTSEGHPGRIGRASRLGLDPLEPVVHAGPQDVRLGGPIPAPGTEWLLPRRGMDHGVALRPELKRHRPDAHGRHAEDRRLDGIGCSEVRQPAPRAVWMPDIPAIIDPDKRDDHGPWPARLSTDEVELDQLKFKRRHAGCGKKTYHATPASSDDIRASPGDPPPSAARVDVRRRGSSYRRHGPTPEIRSTRTRVTKPGGGFGIAGKIASGPM